MAPEEAERRTPGVVIQPQTQQGMQRGIQTLVAAIRPTLGPLHGVVVVEKESKVGRPELLDDGAVIARRIIQVPDRDEDMGVMYLRQVLWSLHEKAGDGTATAAVMFQAIYDEGLRYLAAGGDAMRLREALEAAQLFLTAELEKQVTHLEGKEPLAHLAETICCDPPLAKLLGEIFDIIGADGQLDIRPGRGRDLEREYVEGMVWDSGVVSREMFPDPVQGRVQLENSFILCSDLDIKEAEDLLPALETAVGAGCASLMLVAANFSDRALALLRTNRPKIQVVAVKAPALDALTRSEALEDLALLTGGRAFFQAAGDTLKSVQLADVGQARRLWADKDHLGMVGGKGNPRRLRQHIAQLRAALANMDDPQTHDRLQARIGKLLGGSAVLWVGASTPLAVEARKALAERTAEAMRGAMREGVLPGGGAALLACQPVLEAKRRAAEDLDERMAYRLLLAAVEAPVRALLENAGFNPDKVLARLDPGLGFDVIRGRAVDMAQAGLYDAASVVKAAVHSAIHGAALVLTVEILVHKKNPAPMYHKT
jgi:chaperonin GroEL